jgi:hypothetical protein
VADRRPRRVVVRHLHTCDLTVRLVCPPDDCTDDSLGEWVSYEVALVDGPKETEPWAPKPSMLTTLDRLPRPRRRRVDDGRRQPVPLQAAGRVPRRRDRRRVRDVQRHLRLPLRRPRHAALLLVTPPDKGVVAPIFTFSSVSGMNTILLEAWPTCPDATAPAAEPVLQMHSPGSRPARPSSWTARSGRSPSPSQTRPPATLVGVRRQLPDRASRWPLAGVAAGGLVRRRGLLLRPHRAPVLAGRRHDRPDRDAGEGGVISRCRS